MQEHKKNYENEITTETYAIPPQTSQMESFVAVVNEQNMLAIVVKLSVLDVFGVLATPLDLNYCFSLEATNKHELA